MNQSNFEQFSLLPQIQKALTALGFESPTPIQAKALPVALAGKDIVGIAQTGTGKTAAFSIPMITHLKNSPDKTALILAPTRELVQQIEEFIVNLTRFTPELSIACLIGGAPMQKQLRALQRKPRIIVATPGRLLDHLDRRTVSLAKAQVLILDEADRMLDMGFAPALNEILKYVPKERQTLLFTATWDPSMDALAKKYLKNEERISVGAISQAAKTITQSLIQTTVKDKNDVLLDQLNERKGSCLVFARTKARTDRVAKFLASYGVSVSRIHGGRSQAQRNGALDDFRNGKIRVLVATDIASRGIDVVDIAHVINYDLPMSPDDYIHRIGRTGRNGATGNAITLTTPEDRALWNDIVKLLKKTNSAVPVTTGAPVRPSANRPQRVAVSPSFEGHSARPARPPRPQRNSRPKNSGFPRPPLPGGINAGSSNAQSRGPQLQIKLREPRLS